MNIKNIIANYLQLPKVKDTYFQDYWGNINSLGAWGGDFVLVTSTKKENITKAYFHQKGIETA